MPPEPDCEVGYKKPPVHSRFKPDQSGNPHARPKKAGEDFARLFIETLDETVTLTENGRRRKISKREAFVRQLVNRAAQGDPKSLPMFFRLMGEVDRERKRNRRQVKALFIPDDPKPPACDR